MCHFKQTIFTVTLAIISIGSAQAFFNFTSPSGIYELGLQRDKDFQVTPMISDDAGGSASFAWAAGKGVYRFPITVNGVHWNRHTCRPGETGAFMATNRVPLSSPQANPEDAFLYGKGWVSCPVAFNTN